MAEHLKNILGDMLYLIDPEDDMEFLPSPEELQGKILVKAKKKKSVKAPPLPSSQPPETKEKSPSRETEEIDIVPQGDNAVSGVDDGLLNSPTSPGWKSPPKVGESKFTPCLVCGTLWYGGKLFY